MSKKVEATYDLSKNRIIWRFKTKNSDQFGVWVSASKSVAGARWNPSIKSWGAPASVETCHSLREAFGGELELSTLLVDWYVANASAREEAVAGTYATDAELKNLPRTAPRLFATLRPDQRAGVAYAAEGYRGGCLVADKPGLGKTLQAIGAVLEGDRKGNVLIVCPKISVRSVWQREIQKWTDEPVYIARGTRKEREAGIAAFRADPSERKFLVIVAEMLRVKRKPNDTEVKANSKNRGRIEGYEFPELFEGIVWDTVIADESHRLLGSLSVSKSNLMGEGLMKIPTTPSSRRIAVSGTPFGKGGRIQGMFGTLHWLWPDEYTSFWKWAKENFVVTEEVIGKGGRTAMKVGGLRQGGNGEGFLASLGPRILRRTKEEVLKNLPPKQFVEVMCEMESAQKKQYIQLGADGEVVLLGGVLFANGVLAELTRAKQIANGAIDVRGGEVFFTGESCKIEALMGKLEARGLMDGSGDTKVLISSRYNAFINGALLPRLEKEGIPYHLLTGATSDLARESAMEAFQSEGGPRVFVLNSKAGGVSITLDAADEVHCLDELDNPEDNEQLEDRAHRASRMHQVTVYYYRTEGTIDENIGETVEEKRRNQFAVLDGRRGLEDVREWIRFRASDS